MMRAEAWERLLRKAAPLQAPGAGKPRSKKRKATDSGESREEHGGLHWDRSGVPVAEGSGVRG